MMACSKCGRRVADGAYLVRTSPKGGPFIGQCHPVCGVPWISEDAKILDAITDNSRTQKEKGDDSKGG